MIWFFFFEVYMGMFVLCESERFNCFNVVFGFLGMEGYIFWVMVVIWVFDFFFSSFFVVWFFLEGFCFYFFDIYVGVCFLFVFYF